MGRNSNDLSGTFQVKLIQVQAVYKIECNSDRIDTPNRKDMVLFLGTVTLWSPNVKEPLVKMLCHGSGTRSIAVDQSGRSV